MAMAAQVQCGAGSACAASVGFERSGCSTRGAIARERSELWGCGAGKLKRGGKLETEKRTGGARICVKAEGGFDFWQALGGRGLQGGEAGLNTDEGKKKLLQKYDSAGGKQQKDGKDGSGQAKDGIEGYDAFGKEMSGMVGGFPGGEKGLRQFLQEYPPPIVTKGSKELERLRAEIGGPGLKAKTVVPPLLMPGMTVLVKEPKNPYYMFTGIVQRVTDGRAGVLFEGGNWDKLVTFKLTDLQRSAQGPPMNNPKSAVLVNPSANP